MTINIDIYGPINHDLKTIDEILSMTLNGVLIANQGVKFYYTTLVIDNSSIHLAKTLKKILNIINYRIGFYKEDLSSLDLNNLVMFSSEIRKKIKAVDAKIKNLAKKEIVIIE